MVRENRRCELKIQQRPISNSNWHLTLIFHSLDLYDYICNLQKFNSIMCKLSRNIFLKCQIAKDISFNSRFLFCRLAGCNVNVSVTFYFSTCHRLMQAKINQADGGHGWTYHRIRLPLHFFCQPISSIIFQLWDDDR